MLMLLVQESHLETNSSKIHNNSYWLVLDVQEILADSFQNVCDLEELTLMSVAHSLYLFPIDNLWSLGCTSRC